MHLDEWRNKNVFISKYLILSPWSLELEAFEAVEGAPPGLDEAEWCCKCSSSTNFNFLLLDMFIEFQYLVNKNRNRLLVFVYVVKIA